MPPDRWEALRSVPGLAAGRTSASEPDPVLPANEEACRIRPCDVDRVGAVAAVPTDRATLTNLGRPMPGPARCKRGIKRAARFVANTRVTVADGMAGVIARLARRDVPLVVALDWVGARTFHTLVAAVVAGGRSVPLLWASNPEWGLTRSQNNLEEGRI